LSAQQKIGYTYDEAGNRIQKKIVLTGPIDDDYARKAQKFQDEVGGLDVLIYPNPTSDRVIVNVQNEFDKSSSIVLMDMKGNVLQTVPTINQINEFDLSNYTKGSYILRIINNKKSSNWVIIKN
jgi:hypothetical protein